MPISRSQSNDSYLTGSEPFLATPVKPAIRPTQPSAVATRNVRFTSRPDLADRFEPCPLSFQTSANGLGLTPKGVMAGEESPRIFRIHRGQALTPSAVWVAQGGRRLTHRFDLKLLPPNIPLFRI